ncbi:YfiR/HmsC family protein [Aliidiomarina celeris]|uniref:YfiR/HmsC family protein n=1 Tax=Aliidiomarina celeris TaxID=2249428 RepID=UPI000DEBC3DD|nr:YfiR/HmsC family protein [Aliidiomarina celeris]
MIARCKQLVIGFWLILTCLGSVGAVAAMDIIDISDEELRAAYLTTVTRYVTWPDESGRNTLVIGVMDAPEVYNVLRSSPPTQVRGLTIEAREISRVTQITDVDVLYVGPRALSQLGSIASSARNNQILVVTESSPVREELMINLLPAESSSELKRVAFQVNTDRIVEAGMRPSNELLMLGGVELEAVVAYQRGQREYAELQQQVSQIESNLSARDQELRQSRERIAMLEEAVAERDSVLRAQAGTLEDRQQVMDSQQATLNRLLRELDEQRQRLFVREEQLVQIQQQLYNSEQTLRRQHQLLTERERQLEQKQQESDALTQRIALNRATLANQQNILQEQREAIAEQLELLERRERTINRQREYLIYVGIGLFVALFFALLSIALYLKKRKTAAELMHTLNELHNAQDKLVESEKMASLGNLVAGVAHEVNTPLGVALTATSMLNDRREHLKELIADNQLTKEQLNNFLNKAQESLDLTEKNLSRVARLISNFKQVAVDQMITEQREIDLATYLEEVMSTLSIELRRAGVDYKIRVEKDIQMVTIPGAMAQIITNLTTNAIRHAFENREGTITIEAKMIQGDNVRLTFSDDGLGMSDDTLPKIFEPFFTTKRNVGGTGLGMPIVYNLVRQKMQGDISVKSNEGAGTQFILTFPRVLRAKSIE